MISKSKSFALVGIEAYAVTIEADLTAGLPTFDIVGLPDAAIKEAKERVKAALRNSGFSLPPQKIIVNLAPADIKKEGSSFDLAIAIALLISDKKIQQSSVEDFAFFGELSLAGELKKTNGILSLALGAAEAGIKNIIVPKENAIEASLAEGITVYGAENLFEVFSFLTGETKLTPTETDTESVIKNNISYDVDFAEVKGQPLLKRALEIAAAGGHNVIIMGSPGSGKSMLAKRIPTILPDMNINEAIETTRIYSAAGMLTEDTPVISARPFRSPHHNISTSGLIGGGSDSRPGEVSLAHNGVLFLDEFLEFGPKSMESMRQPVEDGKVTISRAASTNTYPCKMMLVLAANPCPCGYHGDKRRRCTCSQNAINKYLSKLSGPLLDRIDIQVEASSLSFDTLSEAKGESSEDIKKRVTRARLIQKERFESDTRLNSDMKTEDDFKRYCPLDDDCKALLENAFKVLGLSMRGYNSLMTVTRTIADLDGAKDINITHLSEAISYRRLENKYWNR